MNELNTISAGFIKNNENNTMKNGFYSNRTLKNSRITDANNNDNKKTIKMTDVYKNIFSPFSKETIQNLKANNTDLKSRLNSTEIKITDNQIKNNTLKDFKLSDKIPKIDLKHKFLEKIKIANLMEPNYIDTNLSNFRTSNSLSVSPRKPKPLQLNMTQQSTLNNFEMQTISETYHNKSPRKNNFKSNESNYCSYCDHCNKATNEAELKEYIANISEAKSIINRTFSYITNKEAEEQFDFISILNTNRANIDSVIGDKRQSRTKTINSNFDTQSLTNSLNSLSKLKEIDIKTETNSNPNTSMNIIGSIVNSPIKTKKSFFETEAKINKKLTINRRSEMFDATMPLIKSNTKTSQIIETDENLLENLPKRGKKNRNVYKIISRYINAVLEDKIFLENLLYKENIREYNNKVDRMEEANIAEIFFDQDLDPFLNENIDAEIVNNFRENFQATSNIETKDTKKRNYFLFIILIEILAEISSECFEKAVLVFKIFKSYLTEQEKKWERYNKLLEEKILFQKEIIKIILNQSEDHKNRLENTITVLNSNNITEKNLNNHKSIIHDLLIESNKRRDELYLYKSEIEILKNELNFWIFDFENLKLDEKIREKLKEIDRSVFESNPIKIDDENSKEAIEMKRSRAESALKANVEIYSRVLGDSDFLNKKTFYISEIKRLSDLYTKNKFKKANLKSELKKLEKIKNEKIDFLENELAILRTQVNFIKIILDYNRWYRNGNSNRYKSKSIE